MELEEASNIGSFGATSGKVIHSSGLFDELTAVNRKSWSLLDALRNPPLAYTEKYSALVKMVLSANQLFFLATDPSVISPFERSNDFKKSTYKKSAALHYNDFKNAYSKLVTLIPEINQEVQKNQVDLEAIKKRLK
jgi:hypothetical protein